MARILSLKEFKEKIINTHSFMVDPYNLIYKQKNMSLIFANNYQFLTSPFSVIFVTKPNCLNIQKYARNSSENSLPALNGIRSEISSMLLHNTGSTSNFIPVLTNFFENTSFSPMEGQMQTIDVSENRVGVRHVLPNGFISSLVGNDINISYHEISATWCPAIITALHTAWFDYIDGVKYGYIDPGPYKLGSPKQYNFMSSMYYFKLLPDGKTIAYWAKLTGIYPKNRPVNDFGGDNKDYVKPQINYQCQLYEDMKLDIFNDFNAISGSNAGIVASTKNEGTYELILETETD
jgi:hypothetical protein